ncbi:MAG TPA: hypothetical protein VJ914_03400 [Pseudonocardiaceae bacterium]|nr:hypothetical protein [Pseudonocardiaceae bacterium]
MRLRGTALRRPVLLVVAAGLVASLAVTAPEAGADTQLRDNMLMSHQLTDPATGKPADVYDYAPTVVQQGTVQHYYWCGYGTHPSAKFSITRGGTTYTGAAGAPTTSTTAPTTRCHTNGNSPRRRRSCGHRRTRSTGRPPRTTGTARSPVTPR